MDFEQTDIPGRYDAGRGYSQELMIFWLERIAEGAGGIRFSKILDVGCGTGRFTPHLASYFSANVLGIDPSSKMLAEALLKGGENTDYRQAPATKIPAGNETIDFIFLSMVMHHIENKSMAIREFMRVLKPGGRVILRGCSTEQIPNFPFVKWFPGTVRIMQDMLEPIDSTVSRFKSEEFKFVNHSVVRSPVATDWDEYAEKTSHRADSILTQISDSEFEDGLHALRSFAKSLNRQRIVIEPIDLIVFEKIWLLEERGAQ